MPADFDRNDDSLFGSSSDSFQDNGFGDPFSNPSASSGDNAALDTSVGFDVGGTNTFDTGSGDFFGGDAFGSDGDAFGGGGMSAVSGGAGSGGGNRKRRQPLPLWAKLAAIGVAVLLVVMVLAQIFQPETYTISLETDPGEILVSVTEQSDGAYSVSLRHELTGLDASQFYMAGFMMAPEDQTLNAVGEPFYIMNASSYTATATFVITQPGTYAVSFYSYSMLDSLPSLTSTHTLVLGDGTATAMPTDGSMVVIVTPTPTPRVTPTPTPRPQPTETPTHVVLPPSATNTPTAAPKKLRPDSDIFDLYDVSTRYFYNHLTNTQKVIFSEMYDGVVNAQLEIPITPCSRDDYDYARTALMYDCPELFLMAYESGTTASRSFGGQITTFIVEDDFYRLSASAYRAKLEQIMNTIRSFRSQPAFGSSDYSKELAITNYIVTHTRYNKELPNCAYADSVYLYGYAKCTGYSHALNLALRYYGIPCAVVIGRTYDNGVISPISHMWSIVKIDGNWYHCDATWNDNDESGLSAYPYFNLSDRVMLAARNVEIYTNEYRNSYRLLFAPLPDCNTLLATYAKKENYYISAGSNIADTVASQLASSYRAGEKEVYLMFESAADMSTAYIQIMDGSIIKRASSILNTWPEYVVYQYPDVNALILRRTK